MKKCDGEYKVLSSFKYFCSKYSRYGIYNGLSLKYIIHIKTKQYSNKFNLFEIKHGKITIYMIFKHRQTLITAAKMNISAKFVAIKINILF